MWDFSISGALTLMLRTAPYILFRLAVYFGIACAFVVATGAGAGIGYGIGTFGDEDFRLGSAFWGGTAGVGVTAGIIYFLREPLAHDAAAIGYLALACGQVPTDRRKSRRMGWRARRPLPLRSGCTLR